MTLCIVRRRLSSEQTQSVLQLQSVHRPQIRWLARAHRLSLHRNLHHFVVDHQPKISQQFVSLRRCLVMNYLFGCLLLPYSLDLGRCLFSICGTYTQTGFLISEQPKDIRNFVCCCAYRRGVLRVLLCVILYNPWSWPERAFLLYSKMQIDSVSSKVVRPEKF